MKSAQGKVEIVITAVFVLKAFMLISHPLHTHAR